MPYEKEIFDIYLILIYNKEAPNVDLEDEDCCQ